MSGPFRVPSLSIEVNSISPIPRPLASLAQSITFLPVFSLPFSVKTSQ